MRCATLLTSRNAKPKIRSCVVGNYALDREQYPSLGSPLDSPLWLLGRSAGFPLWVAPPFTTTPPRLDTARCNAATSHADQTPALTRAPGETGYTSQPRKRTCTKGDYGPFGIRWGRRMVHDTNGSVKVRTTTAPQGAGCNGSRLFA